MVVTSEITVFKTGYMGKYTNNEAISASVIVQITIDGGTVQSQNVEITPNEFVCIFGDLSGVNTSMSHEICAATDEAICSTPTANFTHSGETCA